MKIKLSPKHPRDDMPVSLWKPKGKNKTLVRELITVNKLEFVEVKVGQIKNLKGIEPWLIIVKAQNEYTPAELEAIKEKALEQKRIQAILSLKKKKTKATDAAIDAEIKLLDKDNDLTEEEKQAKKEADARAKAENELKKKATASLKKKKVKVTEESIAKEIELLKKG